MTQQVINLGRYVGDPGTPAQPTDSTDAAFQKCNANFTELYGTSSVAGAAGVDLVTFQNNPAYGTTGMYLGQSFIPQGATGTSNPNAVIQAAINYSAAQPGLVQIDFPNNVKISGLNNHLFVPAAGCPILKGGRGTVLEYNVSLGQDGTAGTGFICDINSLAGPLGPVIIEDIFFQFIHQACNWQTGFLIPEDQRRNKSAANCGDWTGLSVVWSGVTDPLNPAPVNSTTITYPSTAFPNLAAAQILVGTYPQQPMYFPFSYALQVSTVTQPGGAGTPYIVALVPTQQGSGTAGPSTNYPMSGWSIPNQQKVVAANQAVFQSQDMKFLEIGATAIYSGSPVGLYVTDIVQNVVTFSANVTLAEGQIVTFATGTNVTFLNGPSVFYTGNGINVNGNNCVLRRVGVAGLCHGRQITMFGNNCRILDCEGWSPITTSGCGGLRLLGGLGWQVNGWKSFSGDQNFALGGSSGVDGTFTNIQVRSCGQPLSLGLNVSDGKQTSLYPFTSTTAPNVPGNSLVMSLNDMPIDNPNWSTSNTYSAALGLQAQVAAFEAGDPTQAVNAFLHGPGTLTSSYIVGAVPNPTTGEFNQTLLTAGATVTGVSISGSLSSSNVTLTMAAPAGQSTSVNQTISAGSTLAVNLAYGLDVLFAVEKIFLSLSTFECLNNGALFILNRDSPDESLVTMTQCDFDTRYLVDSTKAGFQIGSNSTSGGMTVRMSMCRFQGAYAQPYEFFGTDMFFVAEDCDFAAPAVSGTPCFQITGVMGGEVNRCRIYGNGGATVVAGMADSFDRVNNILRGNCGSQSPVVFRNCEYHTSDGQWSVIPMYGSYRFDGGAVVPNNPNPTTNTANGIYADSTSIGLVNTDIDYINFSAQGTAALAIGTGGSASLNAGIGCSGNTVGAHNIPAAGAPILTIPGVVDGLVGAAGNALTLSVGLNVFGSAAPGTGCTLPLVLGQEIDVINNSGVALLVAPYAGAKINAGSVGAAYSVGATLGTAVRFKGKSLTQIYANVG